MRESSNLAAVVVTADSIDAAAMRGPRAHSGISPTQRVGDGCSFFATARGRPRSRRFAQRRHGSAIQQRLLRAVARDARFDARVGLGPSVLVAGRHASIKIDREARRTGRRANWSDSCAHSGVRPSVPEDIAEVYRSTYGALVRFCTARSGTPSAPRISRRKHSPGRSCTGPKMRGWLFVVAANMARDEARRAAREKRHLTLLKSEPEAAQRLARRRDRCRHTIETRARGTRAVDARDREALLLWTRAFLR